MSKPAKPNRSDFIRQHPELSPNDVVALGAKEGLKFSRNLVYLVRGPRGATAKKSAPPPSPKPAGRVEADRTPGRREELEIARLILTLGFERSEEILEKLKVALRP